MTSERLPPHDLDAEEAVISSLLVDGTAIHKIGTILQDAEPFYHEPNRWLYQACLSLYQRNEAINQITVAQELDRLGKLKDCGGAAYLSHLIATCSTPLDIEHYAQIVFRLAVSRRLIEAAKRIEVIGYEANPDVDESLNKAEDVLFRLRRGKSNRDLVPIRQVLDRYFEVPPTPGEGGSQPIPQMMSNFTGLDEFLGGFQRSDLIIIAGRPSMGKTSFALSVALNAAVRQGACAAIFSLEMSQEPLVLRMLASEANIDSRRVGLGRHRQRPHEAKDRMPRLGGSARGLEDGLEGLAGVHVMFQRGRLPAGGHLAVVLARALGGPGVEGELVPVVHVDRGYPEFEFLIETVQIDSLIAAPGLRVDPAGHLVDLLARALQLELRNVGREDGEVGVDLGEHTQDVR